MTSAQFLNLLQSSGIPFAYRVWRKSPNLPWGTFIEDEAAVFWADGEPYYSRARYYVLLYTDKKSAADEAALETVLLGAGVSFMKTEAYIESQRLCELTYDCEV